MKHLRAGFTIIELVIVIAVIAILASITVVAYNGTRDRAEYARAQSDLKNINDAIVVYRAQNGKYPIAAAQFVSGSLRFEYQYFGRTTSVNTSFLNTLVASYLDTMPVGSPLRSGKYYTYCYITPADGSEYKLIRYTYDPPLPTVETTGNPLTDPTRPTQSWGYWSPGGSAY